MVRRTETGWRARWAGKLSLAALMLLILLGYDQLKDLGAELSRLFR